MNYSLALSFLIIASVFSCDSSKNEMRLEKFKYETDVTLVIDELDTDDIPREIGQLTHAEKMTVHTSRPEGEWQVYPPVSWYERRELKPPYRTLPQEIGQLKKLKSLSLVHLDINELPPSITQLQNLEFLNLAMNKLKLTEELPKLRRLPNLKHLIVWGNHFDEAEMQQFRADFPELLLEYKVESQSE